MGERPAGSLHTHSVRVGCAPTSGENSLSSPQSGRGPGLQVREKPDSNPTRVAPQAMARQ